MSFGKCLPFCLDLNVLKVLLKITVCSATVILVFQEMDLFFS